MYLCQDPSVAAKKETHWILKRRETHISRCKKMCGNCYFPPTSHKRNHSRFRLSAHSCSNPLKKHQALDRNISPKDAPFRVPPPQIRCFPGWHSVNQFRTAIRGLSLQYSICNPLFMNPGAPWEQLNFQKHRVYPEWKTTSALSCLSRPLLIPAWASLSVLLTLNPAISKQHEHKSIFSL